MSKKNLSLRRSRIPHRSAFTFIEVLLVLAIIALFCICIFGFFISGKHEPLKPPALKPAKTKSLPATPSPNAAAPPSPAAPTRPDTSGELRPPPPPPAAPANPPADPAP